MPLEFSIMSNERQKGVVVSKAIAYGSVATYLGRKSEETKTHRWHIYVRGIENEDLSYMISKVVISLHSSFANPVRGIVDTCGTVRTPFMLHGNQLSFYDELVFNEPTEFMYKKLMTGPEKQAPPNPLQEHWPVYSEAHDLKLLADADAFLTRELATVKALFVEADVEAKELKEKLHQVQSQLVLKKASSSVKPAGPGYP
ncbi:hypothetical protein DYB37_004811 [Aphanomyces astaci]|uniref:YEATS domain-containing protein n=1 Tax=Aphanomyces astaci TaxID=112090 RepID=A0A3R7B3T9_APHAT|nr:hypothetical protein DYB35_010671 [Aphanomyces astaci]RHZ17521.1 hypothetical protein DYB37_004811 [Aphanomyces astaci]